MMNEWKFVWHQLSPVGGEDFFKIYYRCLEHVNRNQRYHALVILLTSFAARILTWFYLYSYKPSPWFQIALVDYVHFIHVPRQFNFIAPVYFAQCFIFCYQLYVNCYRNAAVELPYQVIFHGYNKCFLFRDSRAKKDIQVIRSVHQKSARCLLASTHMAGSYLIQRNSTSKSNFCSLSLSHF